MAGKSARSAAKALTSGKAKSDHGRGSGSAVVGGKEAKTKPMPKRQSGRHPKGSRVGQRDRRLSEKASAKLMEALLKEREEFKSGRAKFEAQFKELEEGLSSAKTEIAELRSEVQAERRLRIMAEGAMCELREVVQNNPASSLALKQARRSLFL